MDITEAVVGLIIGITASGGFWTWLMKRDSKKSALTRLILGLAHDRIIFLGMQYITRGFITKDEYEDFDKYLWQPYSEFGGNGLAEKVYAEVQALPIMTAPPIQDDK